LRTAERGLIAVVVDGSGALDVERPPDTPTLERSSLYTSSLDILAGLECDDKLPHALQSEPDGLRARRAVVFAVEVTA